MKIIYLHQYFCTPENSGGTRSFEFAKNLIKLGHEVTIITSYRNYLKDKKWFKTEHSGISINWIPLEYSNHTSFFKRLKVYFLFAWKCYFKIKEIEGDVIFATSTPLTIALPAILYSRKKKIPMIFEVRDLWPDVPIAMKIIKNPILIFISRLLELLAYKYSTSIVTLSPEMKKGIIQKKIDTKKIVTIPNSADLDLFNFNEKLELDFRSKRPWLNKKPLLLYTGTFGRVNDLNYAVRLAKALKDRNSEIRILLIGDGFEKEKIIYNAKKSDVYNKNLFIESPLPKKEMPACLSAASITANFVVDIRQNWANSANKFFDGLAAGKPILLNHGGWMEELVLKYECGLCLYGKKIELAAEELDLAILNKVWLKSRGEASKKLAEKFFDRNIHSLQLEKVFHLAVNNKPNLTAQIGKNFFD